MYNDYDYSDYLMHYGVKGMKWGVRKAMKTAVSQLRNSKKPIGSGAADSLRRAGGIRQINKDGRKMVKREAAQIKQDYKQSDEYKAKIEKRKKALKVGAAVAGTALAAYGAYKLDNFIREKNTDIRVNEGKTKCDSMLKKLDRMKLNDLIVNSSANEAWVNSGGKTRFQYNNNGRTVTVPVQYRQTHSTLKPTQYMNIERKVIEKTINDAYDKAKNDSFSTAAKNVSKYYLEEAKRRVRDR